MKLKRLIAMIITASLILSFATPVNATDDVDPIYDVYHFSRAATVADALEVLKNVVGIPNDASLLFGDENVAVGDALEILKGIVDMREAVRVDDVFKVRKDHDYMPGQVWIGLKHGYKGKSPIDLFPELAIVEVEDFYLGIYNSAVQFYKENPNVNSENQESVLRRLYNLIGTSFLVTLREETKESALSAVILLKSEKSNIIRFADLLTILKPCI